MPTILVTGATGTIGREVATSLTKRSIPFRASSHHPEAIHEHEVYLDFLKPETFLSTLAGVEQIFLLLPPQIQNVQASFVPFIQTAKQQEVQQIVFLSVMGAENLEEVPHSQIERVIVESGINYTFLRASFFTQNLLTAHRNEIRYEQTLYIPAGLSRTSLIDARDIGEAVALSFINTQHRNKAYTVTGNESLSYYDVAQILTDELGHTITYANPSPTQFREHLLSKGVPDQFIEVMLHVYGVAIAGITEATTPDLQHILGRTPKTVRDFVRDYREQFSAARNF